MSVGVIIPVYNGASYIEAVVRSVRAQTVTDWEMIVVDDGSTDGSAAIAERLGTEDGRIRVVRQPNTGVSAARNRGFDLTHADKVVYLDVDDVWEPDALETLLNALEAAPWASGAHGLSRHIDVHGRPIRAGEAEAYTRSRHAVRGENLVTVPLDQPTSFESEVICCHISTVGTVLFRREPLERAGGFDPALAYAEDWDLQLRVVIQAPITFVDRVVLGKRTHAHNVSNDHAALFGGMKQVRQKLLGLVWHDPQRLRVALLGRRFVHRLNQRQEMRWARESLSQGLPGRALVHLGRAARFSARGFDP